MTQITTPVAVSNSGPVVVSKLLAIHDYWFGASARDSEATIAGSVGRLSSLLSGTSFVALLCGEERTTYLPKLNALNDPTQFIVDTSFGADEDGSFWGDLSEVFTDTAGTTPATWGDSVARINDQLPNGRNAVQASAALRPLLGRAPVDAAPGGAIDQGSGPAFIRFDLSDDVLPTVYPDALTGELIFASRGSGVSRYGFSIGAGQSHSLGLYLPDGDVVGCITREGVLSEQEYSRIVSYYKALGATGTFSGRTSFLNAWRGWNRITSFPEIDVSSGTEFRSAWNGCSSLTSFPLIDTSSGTEFFGAWRDCSSLTSFPLIDTSSGTEFFSAWRDCTSLSNFPLIDTSSGTEFRDAWRDCTSLSNFPLIDTSSGTEFQDTWRGCTSLTSFPLIDTSSGTNFVGAWRNCTSLSNFPANFFDGCAGTQFQNAFANTNLNQTSIDGILVSINSNNTSNGVFNQSGGSAPSAAGQAAIDAMRARGWTVTVTGGY